MCIIRVSGFALVLLTFTSLASSMVTQKEEKVPFEIYTKGYFVKNSAKLSGNPAFVIAPDKESFDRIFGFGAVMGPRPKLVDEKLFADRVIVAVIKSGSALWKYDVESVKRDKDRLIVAYSATAKETPGAKFTVPLILAVPRADVAEVVFVENGKEVGKLAMKK